MGYIDEVNEFIKKAMSDSGETPPAGFKGDLVGISEMEKQPETIIELTKNETGSICQKREIPRSEQREVVVATTICGKDLPDSIRNQLNVALSVTISDEDILIQSTDDRMFLMQGPIYPTDLLQKMQEAEPRTPQEVEVVFKASTPDIPEDVVDHLMVAWGLKK